MKITTAAPADEASPGDPASSKAPVAELPEASQSPPPGSPSSAALQPPPQGTDQSAGGAAAPGGVEEPGGHAGLGCEDEQEACPEWAAGDGCLALGPSFMLESCRRSCGVCGRPSNASVAETVRQSLKP